MSAQILEENDSVTLDASGAGTVTFQPDSFRTWTVTSINVRTDQAIDAAPVPQATARLGGAIVAQTWMGNRSTAGGSPILVQPSQQLTVQWTNGIPGSRATAYLYGTMSMR